MEIYVLANNTGRQQAQKEMVTKQTRDTWGRKKI